MIKKSKPHHQLNDQRTLCEQNKRSDKRVTKIWALRSWNAVAIKEAVHVKITVSHEWKSTQVHEEVYWWESRIRVH